MTEKFSVTDERNSRDYVLGLGRYASSKEAFGEALRQARAYLAEFPADA